MKATLKPLPEVDSSALQVRVITCITKEVMMKPETIEANRRRAEIGGGLVVFLTVTGNIRRTLNPIWYVSCDNDIKARSLARRWCHQCKLPKP